MGQKLEFGSKNLEQKLVGFWSKKLFF